jgi:3-hydroxyisobutyrate dehydrogenase-like beta-hydroxyacid dehydrogenase
VVGGAPRQGWREEIGVTIQEPFRLGLVGYGEIGSTLGRGLRDAGLQQVTAYDRYAFDGPYAALIQNRAREAGVTLVQSNRELAEAADLIVSVTPGSASLDSAAAFAGCLTDRHTFIDFASATPRIKLGVADRLAESGALVGDGAIEGTPKNGYAMPILVSGAAGERVRDRLSPFGMQLRFVGATLGTASGIKILRSVLIKGIEALTDEMLLAARHYGVDEAVLASACKTLSRPWMETVEALIPSGVIHARRRAEELEMSAEAVADAGIEPIMARAVVARLRWKDGLGLKEALNGVEPCGYKAAVDAIAARAANR